jgi:hypothetical protein
MPATPSRGKFKFHILNAPIIMIDIVRGSETMSGGISHNISWGRIAE